MKRKNHGIGLLELMLALAVIVAIVLSATQYYKVTRLQYQVNEASNMLHAVYVAGANYVDHSHLSGDMITKFINDGSLPNDFKENGNPWGGDITAVATNTGGTDLLVSLTIVPKEACFRLQEIFAQQSIVKSVQCAQQFSDKLTFSLIYHLLPSKAS